VEKIRDFADIGDFFDRPLRFYSTGMHVRLGFSLFAFLQPDLMVVDEALSVGDIFFQQKCAARIEAMREAGTSFLFVSHDLNVVRLLCDRVLVMYLGRIVESGPAAEVFAHPQHPYTRALIGSIPGSGRSTTDLLMPVEPKSPIDPSPTTCRFMGRCPHGDSVCQQSLPELMPTAYGLHHRAACHRLEQLPEF